MIRKFFKSRVGYYVIMALIYLISWQINEWIFPSYGFKITCILIGGSIIGEQAYLHDQNLINKK